MRDNDFDPLPEGSTFLGGVTVLSFLDADAEESWCYSVSGLSPTKTVGLLEQVKFVIAHDACRSVLDD